MNKKEEIKDLKYKLIFKMFDEREREGKINESRNVHWMGEGTVNELVLILLILYFMPQMFCTFYFCEKKYIYNC